MASLLENIHSPADLKKLSSEQLEQLAHEMRDELVRVLRLRPAHFASNLGVVELCLALHLVYDFSKDRLIWDTGHQIYPHKLITGRFSQFPTIRTKGGLMGFPNPKESDYDLFMTGHAGCSVSTCLGLKVGDEIMGRPDRRSVAVVGDGALPSGIVFEALNNAGVYDDLPLVVILNDNDMSISPAVGALNRHLARLLSGNIYSTTKKGIDSVLSIAPPLRQFAKRLEDHAKGMVSPATIFQEFGFNYFGPIDGHDLDALVPMLQNVRRLALEGRGPQFLHVVTKKGQGYELAEADPVLYHGPSKFNPQEGVKKEAASKKTFTQVFGEWLCDMAHADPMLIGITPAMREGSGLVEFEKNFPKRYYDVGIAEQHAVTFAAGMACEGMKPVVAIYSTFLQRAYDQLIHDVALQDLPVLFALDRAGLVGAAGATHAGAYDIPFLRCIPNMLVMTPADEAECRDLLTTAFHQPHPTAVRYPRGSGVGAIPSTELRTLPLGKGEIRRKSTAPTGKRVAILAFGTLLYSALEAAESLDATVANMRFVKPLDLELIQCLAADHDYFVTIEDGAIAGGAGSACLEALTKLGIQKPLLQLGLPDEFIEHGDYQLLMTKCGLDVEGITNSIKQRFPAVFVANSVISGK